MAEKDYISREAAIETIKNGCSENDETCAACWLDWLKQEVVSNG